jgi:hypothetical protein
VYKLSYRDTTANSNAPQPALARFQAGLGLASNLVVGIILSPAALRAEQKPARGEVEGDLTCSAG